MLIQCYLIFAKGAATKENSDRPIVDKAKWVEEMCHINNYLAMGLNPHTKGSNERRELPRKAKKFFVDKGKLYLMKTDKRGKSE